MIMIYSVTFTIAVEVDIDLSNIDISVVDPALSIIITAIVGWHIGGESNGAWYTPDTAGIKIPGFLFENEDGELTTR